MDQVRNPPERGFEFFRGFAGDPRAKPTGRHIDKAGFIVDPGDVHRRRFTDNRQLERIIQTFGDPGAGGKIVGGAERQNAQRRTVGVGQGDQRRRHLIDGAIAAARNHGLHTQGVSFVDIARRIAFFPGYPHVNGHTFLAQQRNSLTEQIVPGAFTVEN
ncbi:hypothetical protein D3C75_665710 [compost metagenome]